MVCGTQKNGEENSKKNNKDIKKTIKISVIIFIFILLVVLMTLYSNNETFRNFFDKYIFRKEVFEDNLPKINMEDTSNANIYTYDKNIIVLEKNVLKSYNKMGIEEYNLDIKINTPLVEANNNFLCIAEKTEKRIYLISGRNILWQKNLEEEISNICVNRNGYVSVNMGGTIKTYNSNGTELFTVYLSSKKIIDMDMSEDNNYLAVAEVDFSGITIQSNIKIISMQGPEVSVNNVYSAPINNLIINIKYNNKNNLVCMYDTHVDIIENEQNKELINFADEKILFTDINNISNIIKISKKDTGIFESELRT